jgi:hypothetical protein
MIFVSLIVLLLPTATIASLGIFWLWMWRDMVRNDGLPDSSKALIEWPPVSKRGWTMWFVLCSLPAAAVYYVTVYRLR